MSRTNERFLRRLAARRGLTLHRDHRVYLLYQAADGVIVASDLTINGVRTYLEAVPPAREPGLNPGTG